MSGGRFDLGAIAAAFPDAADTMLLDTYLTDSASRSIRVFRVYRGVPAHYHTQCDEILHVLAGEGTFWIDDPANEAAFAPGHLLVFPRRAVHALPRIVRDPVVFLAIDTPRRAEDDITFVDPDDGSAAEFIARI
ncbi:cupin domain-containing protein [Gluconacetobacter sacchari]|uniref:Cupin domain-containing protein n=2 Tax=Gluconacetobacter sacchari TaxID=92759 RepID=A0A7W4IBT4_9PROT|nr:cupin domain-containing protein [Gluconacetobacter sacchari]MBB2159993.1 cupin domain-containing protein [Gluconacetobacter sacchari]